MEAAASRAAAEGPVMQTIAPLLPQLRKDRAGGHSPPPSSEASAVDGAAYHHEPSPPPRKARTHRTPRPAPHAKPERTGPKPVRWSVVPTSMVMQHNAAWRPVETHRDASAVLATPAAGIAPGFASGVPMTGLRDSTLSEALPALATLIKPTVALAVVGPQPSDTKMISPRPRRIDHPSPIAKHADLLPTAAPAVAPLTHARHAHALAGTSSRGPPPAPPGQHAAAKQTRVSFAEPW